MRSLQGNLRPRSCSIDRAIARSMHQDRGLRFPCNDRTDEVNKLFIIWLIYSCMKTDFVSKFRRNEIIWRIFVSISKNNHACLCFCLINMFIYTFLKKNSEKNNDRSLQENNDRSLWEKSQSDCRKFTSHIINYFTALYSLIVC